MLRHGPPVGPPRTIPGGADVAQLDELGLRHFYSGKVRDLYEVDAQHILMVASDRMSAFDVIMGETVPEKGRVLTALTNYWVREFAGSVPSALVTCDPAEFDSHVPGFLDHRQWHGRTMLARRARMMPLECSAPGSVGTETLEGARRLCLDLLTRAPSKMASVG